MHSMRFKSRTHFLLVFNTPITQTPYKQVKAATLSTGTSATSLPMVKASALNLTLRLCPPGQKLTPRISPAMKIVRFVFTLTALRLSSVNNHLHKENSNVKNKYGTPLHNNGLNKSMQIS